VAGRDGIVCEGAVEAGRLGKFAAERQNPGNEIVDEMKARATSLAVALMEDERWTQF
jgi:hypothetical protein